MPKPSGRGRKAHQAPAASKVAPKAQSPSPPPPVQRPKRGPAKSEHKQASLLNVPPRVKTGRDSNRFGSLAPVDEEEEEDDDGASVVSLAQTDDDLGGPSVEEVDAAVMQGILPEDYRSQWCKDFFDKQQCPRGKECPFAHTVQQLRIDAAIQRGTVREDFKQAFCADEHGKGYCGYGIRCQHAHSAKELRILQLMDQDLLDDEYHTAFCKDFLNTGECRAGIACSAAHSREDLRAEAAVLHNQKPYTYCFALCESFYRTGHCRKGALCDDAHGIQEVRLCSAVHYNELPISYKTQRCDRAKCSAPWKCHFYHSEKDRCRPITRKSVYCPIFQELGGCAVKDCYWAHGVEDLDIRAFAFHFPLANPPRHQGEWDRVGKKPLAVKTGKGKGPAAGASARGTPPRHRGSPTAGHKPPLHHKATGVEQPLAVQLHKMPAQPDTGAGRRHRPNRKGGAKNPNHYKLCREFMEKGHCNGGDCAFAHGKDMLDTRLQEKEGNLAGAADRQQALNLNTARLSEASLFQLKKHKLELCERELKNIGLMAHEARDAARLMGGDLENASAWHFESEGRMRPRQNAEVNVSGEAVSVLHAAWEKGWSLKKLEEQIKLKGGDSTQLFPEQIKAEEDASDDDASPKSQASWQSDSSNAPHTPWQEAAVMQREALGKGIKIGDDGFPELGDLNFGDENQEHLRYEGLQAAYREQQQRKAEQQQQQEQASSSAARTPFADARPLHDDRHQDGMRSAHSLGGMGVGPSTNGFGAGHSHAAPAQPQGTFAAMAPQGSVLPPPPFQALRNPSLNPPPAVNVYGQPLHAEPAQSTSSHAVKGSHPSSGSFPTDFFRQASSANGIPSHQPARPAQQPLSPQQSVPAAGNWQKEMWDQGVNKHAADYSWIQQQSAARSSQQQRPQELEQMPAISAQHAAPRQVVNAAPTSAPTKPSSIVPKEFDVEDFVKDAFC
ncbi:hypothetical protein ABBQ32_003195 [Trebouxia sp. C0010 RCD-2024]